MLSFLWEDCARCFWIECRRGLRQPWMPFPSVFAKYHEVLEQYFDGRCPSTIHPSLPQGTCVHDEAWVTSRTSYVADQQVPYIVKGRVDHLMRFDDGAWGIIDYKTTDQSDANVRKYGRQLHAYVWALENPASESLSCGPIERMGLMCLNPHELISYSTCTRATVELTPTWVEIERDDEAFASFIDEVLTLLSQEDPPPASDSCTVCNYTRNRIRLERNMQRART